jgi:hypothetical protein
MGAITITSDARPVEQLRAVVGAAQARPRPGDPVNVIVVPDPTVLGEGTVRALALLLEGEPTHFRVYRDELGLQPLAEADFLAELDRRRPR